ncbi:MAG TPA: cobalamin-dependent protein [Gemmatimonadales bacterium]|nr:cobalamin-dependent protein [Gemmatimonadales bacterium]
MRLVALRTGLSPHVLRAWERRYSVVSPTRTEGGQRLYSDLDVERLLRLRRLTDQGHAIRRVAGLPLDELARLEEEAVEAAEEEALQLRRGRDAAADAGPAAPKPGQEAIASALQATRRLDAIDLQAILERAAVTLGVPVFIDEVVGPALVQIGHGWAQGSLSVAQEHMATAVFRRVLGWLFRVYEVKGSAPRLVVTTPPGQVHELGALMVAASAAAEGWNVTYLGPNLPVAELVSAARQADAEAVAISAVHQPEGTDLRAILRDIRTGLPDSVPLLVGGAAMPAIRRDADTAGALVIDSLPEFRTVLRRLADEQRK